MLQLTVTLSEMAEVIKQPFLNVKLTAHSELAVLGYNLNDFKEGNDYRIPRDEAIIIAAGFDVLMRKAMMDHIKRLENERSNLPDFSDPVVAARAWADSQEQLRLAAPKVALANRVADIDNHQYIRDVAKQFGWRPKAFTEMLIREKLLYVTTNAHGKVKYPYSHHSDKFVVVQEYINGAMRPVTKITGVGVAHIAEWIDEIDPE